MPPGHSERHSGLLLGDPARTWGLEVSTVQVRRSWVGESRAGMGWEWAQTLAP